MILTDTQGEPTDTDIERVIMAMDGEEHGWASLAIGENEMESPFMLLAGGKDDKVTLGYFDLKNDVEATLMNPNLKGELIALNIGEMTDEIVISKQNAIQALQHFLHFQTLSDELLWLVQDPKQPGPPTLNDTLLLNFISNFYGYGNYDADVWFIGMEEGGGNSVEEINTRLNAWDQRGRHELEDLADYHAAIGITKFFDGQPRSQPTWNKLIRVWFAIRGKSAELSAIKSYQAQEFARSSGDTCLIELMPLPSPNINRWIYGESSGLSYLKDRQTYHEMVRPQRIAHIRALITQFQPRGVIFYGMQYQQWWQEIAGVQFKSIEVAGFKAEIARNTYTTFMSIAHPTTRGITNAYFEAVGKLFDLK